MFHFHQTSLSMHRLKGIVQFLVLHQVVLMCVSLFAMLNIFIYTNLATDNINIYNCHFQDLVNSHKKKYREVLTNNIDQV